MKVLITSTTTARALVTKINNRLGYPNAATKTQTYSQLLAHPTNGTVMIDVGPRALARLTEQEQAVLIERDSVEARDFRAAVKAALLAARK